MSNLVTTYTLDEFKEIQKDQKHPHLGLYQLDGGRIVAFNQNGGSTPKQKLEEIERALSNPTLPDGVYILKGKQSLHPKGVCFDYPILKGDPEAVDLSQLSEDAPKNGEQHQEFKDYNPSVTSYQNVLDLKVENAKLQLQNEALQRQVDELQSEVDLLSSENESLLSEGGDHWTDNLQEFGKSVLTMLSPAIDKNLELKERRIALDEMKLRQGTQAPQMNQRQTQVKQEQEQGFQTDAIDYTNQKIIEFLNGMKNDPEQYNAAAACYNEADNMDDFFNRFKESMGDEKLNELVNFLNNG